MDYYEEKLKEIVKEINENKIDEGAKKFSSLKEDFYEIRETLLGMHELDNAISNIFSSLAENGPGRNEYKELLLKNLEHYLDRTDELVKGVNKLIGAGKFEK